MSLIRLLVACLLAFSAAAIPVDPPQPQNSASTSASSPANTTPKLERIFTAQIQIGDFLAPIPIAGGQRLGQYLLGSRPHTQSFPSWIHVERRG